MAELSWIGLVVYFLSVMAIVLLAATSAGNIRKGLEARSRLVKKVSIGVLALSAGYWYVTVPYAGHYYDFSNKLEYPSSSEVTDSEKYIRDHHHRIEYLETQLKGRTEELHQLREHYQVVLQLGFYAILFYGCMLIFRKKESDESEVTRLNLDDE